MINLENFDGKVTHEEEGKAGNPEVNVVIREFRAGGSAPTEKLLSTSYLLRSMAVVDNRDPSDDIAMVSAHAHTSNKEYSSPQVLDTQVIGRPPLSELQVNLHQQGEMQTGHWRSISGIFIKLISND